MNKPTSFAIPPLNVRFTYVERPFYRSNAALTAQIKRFSVEATQDSHYIPLASTYNLKTLNTNLFEGIAKNK